MEQEVRESEKIAFHSQGEGDNKDGRGKGKGEGMGVWVLRRKALTKRQKATG